MQMASRSRWLDSTEVAELLLVDEANEGSEIEYSDDDADPDEPSVSNGTLNGVQRDCETHLPGGRTVGLLSQDYSDSESDSSFNPSSSDDESSEAVSESEHENEFEYLGNHSRGRSTTRRVAGRGNGVSGRRGGRARRLTLDERKALETQEWHGDPSAPPNKFPFTGQQGITCNIDNNSTAYDCFKVFITKDIIKHIKEQTNKYARTTIRKLQRANKISTHSIWKKWKTVTESDILAFLSITIHMGLVPLPSLRLYWSTHPVYKTAFASQIMNRDRFMSILSMLHINDNETYIPRGQPNHDPLHKVRPVFDKIIKASKESYSPQQKLTVDEGMCPFRGRVVFRVYIKMKPEKYGIKSYVLAESNSGYLLAMDVYTGNSTGNPITIQDTVLDLVQDYVGKGHIIYFDRFYSSPDLFDKLNERQTKAVGTVQSNRKRLPKVTLSEKLKKGGVISRRNGDLLLLKWKDVRDVFMLSTDHTSEMVQVEARGNHEKIKPIAVVDYNKNKAGVDHNDQYGADHPFRRRTLKWWKKFFFHLLHLAYTNAFILFNKTRAQRKECIMLTEFLQEVAMALLADVEIQPPITNITGDHARLHGRHFISRIPPSEKKKSVARVCKVCSMTSKMSEGKCARTETCYECKKCGVSLCINNCFEIFHTKQNYWE